MSPSSENEKPAADPSPDVELLKTLASVSPVGILRADPRRYCTYINQKWTEISGHTLEQARGLGWLRAFHPEDRRRVFAEWEEADRGRRPYRSEFRFRRPDGVTTWLYGQAVAERSLDGRITGYIGTVTDITEHKEAEEALRRAHERARASEERFRDLVESAPDGVVVFDVDGRITLVNARAVEMFGYERDEFLKLPVDELVRGSTKLGPGRGKERDQQPVRGRLEMSAKRRDGTLFPAEIHLNPIEGSPEHGTIALVRDLTERLRQMEAQLKLAALIDASEDAIIDSTLDGTITGWSKGAERTFGYTATEIIGQPASVLIPDSFPSEERDLINRRILKGERVVVPETIRLGKGGKSIDVSLAFSPVQDRHGGIVGIAVICRDITEQKLMERQFHEAQKMDAIGRLAGGVAHDFNNLLTVITGYSSLLGEEMSANHPARVRIQAIRKASEQATDLTRRLLAFGHRQDAEPRVLNLDTTVRDMDRMLRSVLGESVVFETELDGRLGNIAIDPTLLEQVIINLATNARDAMPAGGRLIIQTSEATFEEPRADSHNSIQPGRYALLAATDTGFGMNEETLAHVFEPFFTTKEPGKGTGLGMATTYGTVRQCGGAVGVSSKPGEGTTFRVYFPVVDEPLSPAEMTEMIRNVPAADARVLLVEDNEPLRRLAAEILRGKGYGVIEAHGPVDALGRLSGSSPDLILTDVVMPEMSGAEMIDRMETMGLDGVRVLYMSGYTSDALDGRGDTT